MKTLALFVFLAAQHGILICTIWLTSCKKLISTVGVYLSWGCLAIDVRKKLSPSKGSNNYRHPLTVPWVTTMRAVEYEDYYFEGRELKLANFPHTRILKTRTVGYLTVHYLVLLCRTSNDKQIIGHYLAPPLNLTCKVPIFIEQSCALTLASFVSKSPFSQKKKKKDSHPPLVLSDLIMALQNPRLEKMFTLNLFLRADVQMKQA